MHGHGRLGGEAFEQGAVLRREVPGVGAENKDHADDFLPGDKRQADTGQQAHGGGLRDALQPPIDLGKLETLRVALIGDVGQERRQVLEEVRG